MDQRRPASSDRPVLTRGTLVAGVSVDIPGMGYRNAQTGEIEGFEADLARTIGLQLLGSTERMTLLPVTDAQRIPAINAGEVDLVLAQLTITPERVELVDFSNPYITTREGLLVLSKSDIHEFDDLKNKRIVVTDGSISQLRMQASLPRLAGASLLTTTLTYGGLQAVAEGQADAASNDMINLTMMRMASANPEDYRIIDLGDRFPPKPFGIAVNKNNRGLVQQLNQAIDGLQADGTIQQLLNNTMQSLR
jgi:ABC-type amino acid transport substrate-binding protein